jgi:hypothetical protein
MPPRNRKYKYAELPVFKYQTFDRSTCTFTNHPIISPERFQFTAGYADDEFQSKEPEPEPEPEIITLDDPVDEPEIIALDTPPNEPDDDDSPAEPAADGKYPRSHVDPRLINSQISSSWARSLPPRRRSKLWTMVRLRTMVVTRLAQSMMPRMPEQLSRRSQLTRQAMRRTLGMFQVCYLNLHKVRF